MLKGDEDSSDGSYVTSMINRGPQTSALRPWVTYTEVEHPLHGLFVSFFPWDSSFVSRWLQSIASEYRQYSAAIEGSVRITCSKTVCGAYIPFVLCCLSQPVPWAGWQRDWESLCFVYSYEYCIRIERAESRYELDSQWAVRAYDQWLNIIILIFISWLTLHM